MLAVLTLLQIKNLVLVERTGVADGFRVFSGHGRNRRVVDD
jgi:hypothetical protein